jgi:hypothetical protein
MEKPAKKSTRKPATKPNITIQVIEVTDETKKKGRKPKGGKLITKMDDSVQHAAPLANVILHLKCSTKELNEYTDKCNKMTYDGMLYDPSGPPTIMTYNVVNDDQYALYDNGKEVSNAAYTEPSTCDVCKVCKEKMEVTDITNDDSDISMKDVNTKLKKLKIANPMNCPSLVEVKLLNKVWGDYYSTIADSCQNDNQLQQRFIN